MMERGGSHARRGGIVHIGEVRVGARVLPERARGRHVHAADMLGERCVTGECHGFSPRGRHAGELSLGVSNLRALESSDDTFVYGVTNVDRTAVWR